MDEKKLKALAAELAKGLKTEADLNQFSRMLTKLTVETALNAELTDHLGHEKNAPKSGSNTRNGYSSKTVLCDDGEIELNTPRDRENTFEPQLIKKHQTRITQMDSQILSLYAKGMTTREIVATFKEMYDADVSPTLISKVTDAVKEQVSEWQNRPLDALYPIVYLDCIVNRPGFPGEYFICELRLPDHYFRWKHNKLFLLLPEEYVPAFPAIVDCYTSPPTLVWPVPLLSGFSSSYGVLPPLCKDH